MEKNVKKENRTIRQISVSALALILSAVLLFGAVVGGTLAWLMRKSETLTNTFILGNITSFTLFDDNANASNDYKASLPLYVDNKIGKSTKITVGAYSVNCYVYVKVETSANFSKYVEPYQMESSWIQLKDDQGRDVAGVFYQEYIKATSAVVYQVLKGENEDGYREGMLKAKASFPVDDLEEYYKPDKMPWIRFTGYAVQKEAGTTATGYSAYTAWVAINEQIAAEQNQNNPVAP